MCRWNFKPGGGVIEALTGRGSGGGGEVDVMVYCTVRSDWVGGHQ